MDFHMGRPYIIQLRLTGALGLILLSMGILGGELPQRARETALGRTRAWGRAPARRAPRPPMAGGWRHAELLLMEHSTQIAPSSAIDARTI